jgi:hypothetical protein
LDVGSYEPTASAGTTGSALGGTGGAIGVQSSNGASAGRTTVQPSSSGGSGFAAAGTRGSFAGGTGSVGVGGSAATAGSLGSGGASGGARTAGGGTSVGGSGFAFAGGSGRGTASGGGAAGRGSAGAKATGGMPGVAGSTGTVTSTFSAVASIIQQHCGASGCHGGARNPRLTNNSNLYKTLTSTTVEECASNHLVTPSDPTNSALLMLPNWECDDFVMPEGCVDMPCLSATELATITAWIQAGAPSK